MGAAQSWLCGSNLGREDNLLQSGSRHTNGFTHPRELHAVSLRPVISSTPQGPSYSSGSLEAKYEMLDEIGGTWRHVGRVQVS
uniref:Uncharacterized protein n=1 Tax=Hyaloperonospora arabidopsidis (strain Emoy2) TaxID=559515 RepID=M4BFI0_HYAAE